MVALELLEFVIELFICRIAFCLDCHFHTITAGQGMTGTLPEELSELVFLQSIALDWNGFYLY
jgi:hypothetical protein